METMFHLYEDERCETLVLTASLATIGKIFRLHTNALRRIEREVENGETEVSTLHFNGRPNNLGLDKVFLIVVES